MFPHGVFPFLFYILLLSLTNPSLPFFVLSPTFSELFLESNRKTLKYFSYLESDMLLIYGLGPNVFKHRVNRSYTSTEPLEIKCKGFLGVYFVHEFK